MHYMQYGQKGCRQRGPSCRQPKGRQDNTAFRPRTIDRRSLAHQLRGVDELLIARQRVPVVGLALLPFLGRWRHPIFWIDSQSIGDPIDVVEVGDDLCRDGDLIIVQPVSPQATEVGLTTFAGTER